MLLVSHVGSGQSGSQLTFRPFDNDAEAFAAFHHQDIPRIIFCREKGEADSAGDDECLTAIRSLVDRIRRGRRTGPFGLFGATMAGAAAGASIAGPATVAAVQVHIRQSSTNRF